MFKKILIANRGEIALRVIRTCRELGIQTVAVFSDSDRTSLPVLLADEAYHIGPAASRESYLNIEKLVEAIKETGADAVHPGYGFLSENAEFAQEVLDCGISFIGPSPSTIAIMGDKLKARNTMRELGVPIIPGCLEPIKDYKGLEETIKEIGYPVLIKAAAGGGGKGMRLVNEGDDLKRAFEAAQSEALNYFSNELVYVEKYICNPKHIEIQVLGDTHGNVVHLYDRDCSIQRRHQKIIEEAPCAEIPDDIRQKMCDVAIKAASSINYCSAGTFEFIFDTDTDEFYFLEMNTRLQVEHAVSEMITGIDLVKQQIFVAAGEKLPFTQEEIKREGHAIEARIYAEDPETFFPSPGRIIRCRHPQGPFIRIDSYVYAGYEVPIDYDPMVAKLIAWGKTRQEAIERLRRALSEFTLAGVKTNIIFQLSVLEDEKFLSGDYTTQFLNKDFKGSRDVFRFTDDRVFLIAAAIEAYKDLKSRGVWDLNLASQWKMDGRLGSMR
jgi:acetyl-CoA carboxylase biotin carboxylase subunit